MARNLNKTLFCGLSTACKSIFVAWKLAGKIFVISGIFENYSRDELKDLVENNGGKMASGITSKTNFLIAGNGVGPSKLEKAQQLGVTFLSEDALINMIQEWAKILNQVNLWWPTSAWRQKASNV